MPRETLPVDVFSDGHLMVVFDKGAKPVLRKGLANELYDHFRAPALRRDLGRLCEVFSASCRDIEPLDFELYWANLVSFKHKAGNLSLKDPNLLDGQFQHLHNLFLSERVKRNIDFNSNFLLTRTNGPFFKPHELQFQIGRYWAASYDTSEALYAWGQHVQTSNGIDEVLDAQAQGIQAINGLIDRWLADIKPHDRIVFGNKLFHARIESDLDRRFQLACEKQNTSCLLGYGRGKSPQQIYYDHKSAGRITISPMTFTAIFSKT